MIDSTILEELSSLGLTGPQYQAVLSILSRIETRAETLRAKGRERTSRWRKRNVKVTVTDPPKEKTQTPNPVANATAHELQTDLVWKTCPTRLEALGLSEKSARSNIGRWLRGYGPAAVLEAITAAERLGTRDPVPYVTKTLKAKGAGNNVYSFRPTFKPEPEVEKPDEAARKAQVERLLGKTARGMKA